MSGMGDLFQKKQEQERIAMEKQQRAAAEALQANIRRIQREEDIARRGNIVMEQMRNGPIPDLMDQAAIVLNNEVSDLTLATRKQNRSIDFREGNGRVYARVTARRSTNKPRTVEVEARLYEDGEVEIIGAKTKRLQGRQAQDIRALDQAIGDAVQHPNIVDTFQRYIDPQVQTAKFIFGALTLFGLGLTVWGFAEPIKGGIFAVLIGLGIAGYFGNAFFQTN